ncbi:target of rapamycin complex 2 subunit MAPKAP1 [Cloeon dipterum]|uniref:target of rapamycin complex 2 subunit MAPKAP1 n=1 Tax=Cloeon dipterum TaxID=197152 RepID=UPI00321FE5D9
MALYDNKHWLLSHIRHSFIFSDESGFSEMVMMDEDLRVPSMKAYPDLDQDEEDEDGDAPRSLDVNCELDFGAHRRRVNTAQKLEKMDLERKRIAKMTSIKWEDPMPSVAEVPSNAFERKVVDNAKKEKVKRTSTLSAQLKDCPVLLKNPFFDYSKFDGNAQVGVPVKRYIIFLTMLPERERNYPLHVTIVNTAKVKELVGLVLWKCSEERNAQLEDESAYALHIAEDDGEVDWDFPCLDEKEVVSKFGFNYLALVQKTEVHKSRAQTMSMPLSSLGWSALAERDEKEIEGAEESALQQQAMKEAEMRMKGHMTAMEAPLYQSFQVYIMNRVRVRSAVHLGISGEKIEIDPVVQHKATSQLWGKRKAATYDITRIAACELVNQRSSKSHFRLVHQSLTEDPTTTFKTLEFEAENFVAQEIVQKINHILELRATPVWKEYLVTKERKSTRRRSFSFSLK